MATTPPRPSKEEIAQAAGRTIPDVLGPNLRVLFCGINPGLYSGAVGHHFARPGNRFWKALHAAGFTDRVLPAWEQGRLLDYGLGITNLVRRATAGAAELSAEELWHGAKRVTRLVCRHEPKVVAFVGAGAYRTAFGDPTAAVGPQPGRICRSRIWLLPNPSGLNAHYQLPELAAAFRALGEAVSS